MDDEVLNDEPRMGTDGSAEQSPLASRAAFWAVRLFPAYMAALAIAYVVSHRLAVKAEVAANYGKGGANMGLPMSGLLWLGVLTVGLAAVALGVHRGNIKALRVARGVYPLAIPTTFASTLVGLLTAGALPLAFVGLVGLGYSLVASIAAWSRRLEALVWSLAESTVKSGPQATTPRSPPIPGWLKGRGEAFLNLRAVLAVVGALVFSCAGFSFYVTVWQHRELETGPAVTRSIASYEIPLPEGRWGKAEVRSDGSVVPLLPIHELPNFHWGTEARIVTQWVRRPHRTRDEMVTLESTTARPNGEYTLDHVRGAHLEPSAFDGLKGRFRYSAHFECRTRVECARLKLLLEHPRWSATVTARHSHELGGSGPQQVLRVELDGNGEPMFEREAYRPTWVPSLEDAIVLEPFRGLTMGEEELAGLAWADTIGTSRLALTEEYAEHGAECLSEAARGDDGCEDRIVFHANQFRLQVPPVHGQATWREIWHYMTDVEEEECAERYVFRVETGDWSVTDVDADGVAEATFLVAGGCRAGVIKTVSAHMAEDGVAYSLGDDGAVKGEPPAPRAHAAHLRAVWEQRAFRVGGQFPP